MLYDPKKWAPKAPLMSLAGLASWLATKDPNERYSYTDIGHCLLAQYFRARGCRWAFCSPRSVIYYKFFVIPITKEIPFEMNAVALGERTFGKALEACLQYQR